MRNVRLVFVFGLFVATTAHTANEGGNGGGGYASHFAGVGKRAGQALKLACTSDDAPRNVCSVLPAFLEAVALADVLPRDQVNGPDGKPRDAINDGQRTIQIDIHRWPMLVTQPNGTELQVRLAVHEYLGIARIEGSDNYSVSDSIIALLKQNNFSITQIAGKPPVDPIFSAAVRVSGGSAGAVEQAARKGASDAAIFKCTQATGAVCKVSASQVIQSWSQQDWMGYSTYYCDASAIADPTSQK